MDLKNKNIVITGGGQGLGRAMAIQFAQKGANIALIDLNQAALDQSVDACKKLNVTARAYIANVSNEAEVESCFEQIIDDFSNIHGLINNAGIIRDAQMIKVKNGKIEKRMSLAQWQAVIDVNLTGVFLCGREAATKMIEANNEGVIINISSIARAGNFGQSNYSAAKAGVAAMAVTWAKELARYNIRTGSIAPGTISTEMLASMPTEARTQLASGVPLKRLGEPHHIAQAAVYIFENDYMSGRMIEVDGGLRL